MKVTIGVDPAGGAHDRCAVVVVEHAAFPKPRPKGHLDKVVRRVVRLPELAGYEEQADAVVAVAAKLPRDTALIVEAGGGYGTGVIGYLREARLAGRLALDPRPMNLSGALPAGPTALGGSRSLLGEGVAVLLDVQPQTSIPKVELYTNFARESRAGRVHVPASLTEADQLRLELLGMENQATPTGRLTFNNDRDESEFDDVFCAAALAVRFAGRGEARHLNADGTESQWPFCRTCGTPTGGDQHIEAGHGDHAARP